MPKRLLLAILLVISQSVLRFSREERGGGTWYLFIFLHHGDCFNSKRSFLNVRYFKIYDITLADLCLPFLVIFINLIAILMEVTRRIFLLFINISI